MDDKNGVFSGQYETYGQQAPPVQPPQYGQQMPPQYGQQMPPQYGQQMPPQYGQQMPPQYGQQIPPQYQQKSYTQQMPPQYGQQMSPVQPPQKLENRPGIAGKVFNGILVSFVIMGLFIGIQFVTAIVMMIAAAMQYALEAPGDVAYVTRMLTKTIQDGEFMTNLTVIATAISAVFAVFFYWLLWGRKKPAEDKQYFREKVLRGKNVVMICVGTVGLYFVSILISDIIGIISPETMKEYNEMMDIALGGNIFMAVIAAVVLAPISEECIMRGMIFRNLQKYFSVPAAIIIQAIMFGIFHMNWVQGLYVLPIGAALGFVAAKSKSVFPCICMHMFYNFMSVVLAILPEFCETIAFCIVVIPVCAAVVWAVYKHVEYQ